MKIISLTGYKPREIQTIPVHIKIYDFFCAKHCKDEIDIININFNFIITIFNEYYDDQDGSVDYLYDYLTYLHLTLPFIEVSQQTLIKILNQEILEEHGEMYLDIFLNPEQVEYNWKKINCQLSNDYTLKNILKKIVKQTTNISLIQMFLENHKFSLEYLKELRKCSSRNLPITSKILKMQKINFEDIIDNLELFTGDFCHRCLFWFNDKPDSVIIERELLFSNNFITVVRCSELYTDNEINTL